MNGDWKKYALLAAFGITGWLLLTVIGITNKQAYDAGYDAARAKYESNP